MYPGQPPSVAARPRPRYNENMGTSAIVERARGRAITVGHALGAPLNASADTGQAIPIGRAVAVCEACIAVCNLPDLTQGYYQYAFAGTVYPPISPPVFPTTVGAQAFDFLPNNPTLHGLSLTTNSSVIPVGSPVVLVPFGPSESECMWFTRFTLNWTATSAFINLKIANDDAIAVRYRNRSVCGSWINAGEFWYGSAPPTDPSGRYRYSNTIPVQQNSLYDIEIISADFGNRKGCEVSFVFNPSLFVPGAQMESGDLDGLVPQGLFPYMSWYPY